MISTSNPASCCLPAPSKPNSRADLIALIVSEPAFARPMIFAWLPCACTMNDENPTR